MEVKKTLAEDDESRLISQQRLAEVYLEDEQLEKAVELFRHVVAIRERALEEDDPDLLESQKYLARALDAVDHHKIT